MEAGTRAMFWLPIPVTWLGRLGRLLARSAEPEDFVDRCWLLVGSGSSLLPASDGATPVSRLILRGGALGFHISARR